MEKFQSLAESLGLTPPPERQENEVRLEDITDAKAFADAVISSREFRQFIVDGLTTGEIPPAILIRVMDLAGWQKPPDRVEHTGKDGKPIETVTEVRRTIVRTPREDDSFAQDAEDPRVH